MATTSPGQHQWCSICPRGRPPIQLQYILWQNYALPTNQIKDKIRYQINIKSYLFRIHSGHFVGRLSISSEMIFLQHFTYHVSIMKICNISQICKLFQNFTILEIALELFITFYSWSSTSIPRQNKISKIRMNNKDNMSDLKNNPLLIWIYSTCTNLYQIYLYREDNFIIWYFGI